MTPDRLEALRAQHEAGMALSARRALAEELFAEVDRLTAELAQARSAIQIADATTGRRTAQRDQARAAGFAEAVAMLRDDSRYANWWSAVPPTPGKPTGRYWDATARGHLADYLETVVQPLPRKGGDRVKISRYCACGATLTGHVTPDRIAERLVDAWDQIHFKPGCAPVAPEHARAARRRADRTTTPNDSATPSR